VDVSDEARLAVIDVGSNSFRLVVFSERSGSWRRTDEIHEPVRIGEGLGDSTRLADAPMDRALAALEVFAHFCHANGLSGRSVRAVATSAVRDADNGPDFLQRAREYTGLDVGVLSQAQEAYYGYLAAVNSTTLADGAVLDLGGGSMQLARVDGRLARETGSWPLGAVRMTERFLPEPGPVKARRLDALRAHVTETLADASWLGGAGPRLVGVGGTVRNLGAALQGADSSPSPGIQGFVVERAALSGLVDLLAALPAAKRGGVRGIKPDRGDIILAGAACIEAVLDAGGFEGIEVTEAGLREGIFFEHLLRAATPPLFDDVRRSSVLNLAASYRVDPRHTEHVARLAIGLYDELGAAGLHPVDPIERELLWAACVLHDIGMSVDYDDHHKHSRYLILNAGLPGFTPTEVAVIAQTARYHRKGNPEPGPLAELFAEVDVARLERCSALLRLAESLERSRDQLVRAAHADVSESAVRLTLDVEGRASVPRWAAARQGDVFERAFGRKLIVADA
jgi:exopolyphosphatase / guanosine-5'-triphosphate,3'-diphosphate pyrophosphatase